MSVLIPVSGAYLKFQYHLKILNPSNLAILVRNLIGVYRNRNFYHACKTSSSSQFFFLSRSLETPIAARCAERLHTYDFQAVVGFPLFYCLLVSAICFRYLIDFSKIFELKVNQAYSPRICATSIENSKIYMSLYSYLKIILFFYYISPYSLS